MGWTEENGAICEGGGNIDDAGAAAVVFQPLLCCGIPFVDWGLGLLCLAGGAATNVSNGFCGGSAKSKVRHVC
jgi:hypothetical protein